MRAYLFWAPLIFWLSTALLAQPQGNGASGAQSDGLSKIKLFKYNEAAFEAKLKQGPVGIYFHKQGCPSCIHLLNTLGELYKEAPYNQVSLYMVDIQSELGKSVMKKYGIGSWSVVLLFKQGQAQAVTQTMPNAINLESFRQQFKQAL